MVTSAGEESIFFFFETTVTATRIRKRGEATGDKTSPSVAAKEKDKLGKDSADDGRRKANGVSAAMPVVLAVPP